MRRLVLLIFDDESLSTQGQSVIQSAGQHLPNTIFDITLNRLTAYSNKLEGIPDQFQRRSLTFWQLRLHSLGAIPSHSELFEGKPRVSLAQRLLFERLRQG
jgi:hypothetical protein